MIAGLPALKLDLVVRLAQLPSLLCRLIPPPLAGSVDGFVVDNHRDERLLKEIGRRVGQVFFTDLFF